MCLGMLGKTQFGNVVSYWVYTIFNHSDYNGKALRVSYNITLLDENNCRNLIQRSGSEWSNAVKLIYISYHCDILKKINKQNVSLANLSLAKFKFQ